ncbi:MAG: DUF1330 domain-containing protein [Proteobacteria bacterium]|nr:DUF1330 domain-containing protein [Pseudomonadota bacterium]
MKISQYPNPERIGAFIKNEDDSPVVMVNLLKFKAKADAPDEGLSGMEAYAKYGAAMRAIVESAGGRLIWSGRVTDMVIGESDVDFDMVALMEYPSRQAFAKIVADARVQSIGVHRAAGLLGQWLLATTQTS